MGRWETKVALFAFAVGCLAVASAELSSEVPFGDAGSMKTELHGNAVEVSTVIPPVGYDGAVEVAVRNGTLEIVVDTGSLIYSQSSELPEGVDETAYKLVTENTKTSAGQEVTVLKVVLPILTVDSPLERQRISSELCYQTKWTRQQREFCLCHNFHNIERAACFMGIARSISEWAIGSGMNRLGELIQRCMGECYEAENFIECVEATAEMCVASVTAIHEMNYIMNEETTGEASNDNLWQNWARALSTPAELARFEDASMTVAHQFRAENPRKLNYAGFRLMTKRRWRGLRVVMLACLLVILAIEVVALGMEGLGLRKLGELSLRKCSTNIKAVLCSVHDLISMMKFARRRDIV